jgi:aminoglycoside phosphotransferase (APT) family kinase protein
LTHPKLIEPVSDECLSAIVRKALGPAAVIHESHLLTGGQFNTAYYLETRSPAERVVLRIAPPDDRRLFQYERGMMQAEPWIYRQLAAAGVPVPETIALDTSRDILDRVYIVQEYVDALPLNHSSVPPEARAQLMREAGKLTTRIHAIRGNEFGWPVGDGALRGGPTWRKVFGDLLAETCTEAAREGVISDADENAVLERFMGRRAAFDACIHPVLVHNDIWAPNILVAELDGEWSVRAIIDADRALFADREFEYILWDDDDALHDDLMAGYGTPLDASRDARWRRLLYRFYWYLFAAWAYRAQIWRPDAQAWCQGVADTALRQILRT